MNKYVDLDAILDVLAKDHEKRTAAEEAEILKVWDEIKKIPKANVFPLPCEFGQTAYFLKNGKRVVEAPVFAMTIKKEKIYLHLKKGSIFCVGVLNKDVFLNRESAEIEIERRIKNEKKA